MKTKMMQGLTQVMGGFCVCVMAVYAMIEMFLSESFLAVYDAAGNWHLLPQLTRYLLYIVLGGIAIFAAYVVYCGGRFLIRRAKKLF